MPSIRNLLRLATAAFYTIALTYLLLAPDPWSLFGFLSEDDIEVPPMLSDYVIHGITYCGLAAIWIWAARPQSLLRALLWVVGAIGHGVAAEVLQGFVPGRYPDLLDGVADALGAAVGGVGIVLVLRCFPAEPSRIATQEHLGTTS